MISGANPQRAVPHNFHPHALAALPSIELAPTSKYDAHMEGSPGGKGGQKSRRGSSSERGQGAGIMDAIGVEGRCGKGGEGEARAPDSRRTRPHSTSTGSPSPALLRPHLIPSRPPRKSRLQLPSCESPGGGGEHSWTWLTEERRLREEREEGEGRGAEVKGR